MLDAQRDQIGGKVERSERFKPIQRIVGNRERKAAAALGESMRSRQDAQSRLVELERYRDEYLERYRLASLCGMNAATARDYQAFLAKLDVAIVEQRKQLDEADVRCEDRRGDWRQRYTHSKAMNNAVDRFRDEERRDAERREQKAIDDRVKPR